MNGLPDLPAQTPVKDLIANARKHYEELANTSGWWSSTIEYAINALERQERANKRLHLTAFGVTVDLFITIGGGR